MNVFAGDFDGDGKQEIATVTRTFPGRASNNMQMRVNTFKYDSAAKSWATGGQSIEYQSYGSPRATRADVDGDGRDEIVVFLTLEQDGTYYPELEMWYFNQGSLTPIRHNIVKGGRGSNDLLGQVFAGSYLNNYYYFNEAFSITAGPLTGRTGKVKLADDIAISRAHKDGSWVFVVPTLLDSNKNYAGFGGTRTVYSDTTTDAARRASLITSDFTNEVLMLGEPVHTMDTHDESFIAVLQALPYHVDNVDTNGNLTDYPINYTFSGFAGDEGNGQMSVSYTNTQESSGSSSVSYKMASTTENIALLGEAGPYVHGYLKFRTIEANLAAKADERFQPVASAMNGIMDFITDKIDTTTTSGSVSAYKETIQNGMTANDQDSIMMSYAPQHFWRYPILNDPLPKWFVMGQRADYDNGSVEAESKKRYLSFSMYDEVTPNNGSSRTVPAYQPRHEEGNFFSYPATIDGIEGYNASGALSSHFEAQWNKGTSVTRKLDFSRAQTATKGLDDEIKKSELTKTISAIATALGFDDPDPLPKYTSHSETFSKEFSTNEEIDISLQGRSTLPGENAGHTLLAVPYITREGTTKVGTAVQLNLNSRLWREKLPDDAFVSRYRTYPDPSLVLPNKFRRNGATFAAESDNYVAMEMRGVRFYVPALALDSTKQLLGGLTYKIRVPVYNASFLDTNFDVKLSYASQSDLSLINPSTTEIGTVHVSLGGWSNLESDNNKGWAEFDWDVPADLSTGHYRFYVQIDPENKLEEVHESRLNSGNISDVGGNNEGYFNFDLTSLEDAVEEVKQRDQGVKASGAKRSSPVLYRTAYRQGQGEENVAGAAQEIQDETGEVKTDVSVKIGEGQELELIYLLQLVANYYADELSLDVTIPLKVTIEYNGDEYYHEAIFSGLNYKEGAFDRVGDDQTKLTDDDVQDAFFVYNTSLVPHSTNEFIMNIIPHYIDIENGAGFTITVPDLVETINDTEEENNDSGNDSGNDNSGNDNSDSDNKTPGSSGGGGCDAGFSVLAFGLVLSGLIVGRKRR